MAAYDYLQCSDWWDEYNESCYYSWSNITKKEYDQIDEQYKEEICDI